MLDWTNRDCRYFHRLLAPNALLYTEMVTTGALLNGDPARHLDFNAAEHPLALQLGGSDPADLARCAQLAAEWGYDEVNLNVGCPSDRVQKGRFGACLMKEPALVGECVAAMRAAVEIPVTVKTRIGVDERDQFEHFTDFIERVADISGCTVFIVHARKAWLKGLSPKQNRTVPPLDYSFPARLKAARPDLTVVLNGGIETPAQVNETLHTFDGAMVGRAAWNDPWMLRQTQMHLWPETPVKNRAEILDLYSEYCENRLSENTTLHRLIRPVLGLYHGLPGNKKFKCHLSTESCRRSRDLNVITEAREYIAHDRKNSG